VGKFDGKRLPGRPRHRWEDTIQMDLLEVGWRRGLHRYCSGQGQVAGCCECGNEPSGPIKWEEYRD
jgi:hypothetical protein